MLLKDSLMLRPGKDGNVVSLSKKLLNKHKPPLRRKEKRATIKELIPNIDNIKHLLIGSPGLEDRFKAVISEYFAEFFIGYGMGRHDAMDIADIILSY